MDHSISEQLADMMSFEELEQACMNRKKKAFLKLKARAKKANAKLAPQNKPKYISKAERAKLEAASEAEPTSSSDD